MTTSQSDMLFTCPSCKQHLKAPREYSGKPAECPACGTEMRVPASVMDAKDDSVFRDPGNLRWVWMQRVFFTASFLFLMSLICLSISIVINPTLPALSLGMGSSAAVTAQYSPPVAEEERMAGDDQAKVPPAWGRSGDSQARYRAPYGRPGFSRPADFVQRRRQDSISGAPLNMAFVVTGDPASTNALKDKWEQLDVILPEWLKMLSDGSIEITLEAQQAEVVKWFSSGGHRPKLVPVITSSDKDGIVSGKEDIRLPSTDKDRETIIKGLMKYAASISADGLCVGLDRITSVQRYSYILFLRRLAERLHSENKVLYVCLPAEMNSLECRHIGQIADMAIVMAFSRPSAGTPAPLAGQKWFAEVLNSQAAGIPREKLAIAFGNYAGDWCMKDGGVQALSFDNAMAEAQNHKALIEMRSDSLNPWFSYNDDNGWRHEVWMLDAVTAFNQLASAKHTGPRAFVLWHLGSEDPTLWKIYGRVRTVESGAWQKLADIEHKQGVSCRGEGEIIRIVATPGPGRRSLKYDDKRGLITVSRYDTIPTQYLIQRYGGSKRKIALTFDDGPDQEFTGAMLDVLAEKRAPATFFILGKNGEMYPDLLRRMYREGHEIGVHTFTHPNISRISQRQLEREVAATQRLIEGAIGHDTLLFRPPYGEDTDPSTAEEMRSLGIINDLGYWTVGMHIDPDDWRSPPADTIVKRIIAQVRAGQGNIVLLHDSGGDRSRTVAALPEIIDQLRDRGYEMVTISELLGSTRDEVMPAISGAHRIAAYLNSLMFGLAGCAIRGVQILFKLAIVLGLARLIFIGLLAVMDMSRKRRTYHTLEYRPTVAVIVPGYNEEKVICKTIVSLLDSKYPYEMEIIVVDDGSTDATYERAHAGFASHPQVRVFRKENGGKSSALNFGISQTNAEIIVAMDADTVFVHDTVWNLVRHFENERVGAVAGNAKVGNRINMLTRWQALEYVTSQNLDRRAFNVLNCITVVPGAVGAWRRELVVKAGGFRQATLAEDADLTMAIRRLGYSIVNDSEAYAYTEAPDTLKGFLRQRYRWMYGTLQAAWKHKWALFNPRYGALGMVALPNIFVFQVLFPLISPAIDLFTLYILVQTVRNAFMGVTGSSGMLVMVLGYFLLFTLTDVAVVLLAFAMEPKEDKKLLWSLIPQRFVYRQLMYYVAVKSAFSAMRGMEVKWGHIKRKASVKV